MLVLGNRMTRKTQIIGILAAGLMAIAAGSTPGIDRVFSSAQSLHRNLQTSKPPSDSLSPVERFVFKLMLRTPKSPQANNHIGTMPERHS